MILKINHLTFDISKPYDISIPLSNTETNPIAWYIEKPVIEPVRFGDWVGKVSEGSAINFNTISFNPHGHGTHTECLGHITKQTYSINQCLKEFFFVTEVITVQPEQIEGDLVITKKILENKRATTTEWEKSYNSIQALVIRTLPNTIDKKSKNYSHTNPPYLTEETAIYLRELGIKHLLVDLPSIDRENDQGKLLAHKAFWNVKDSNQLNSDARLDCTITEMIFVDDTIVDGTYLLNLQTVSFENDASPSKPVLYAKDPFK
ncbi:cyclase family protein [Flavobacterium columnare]|uniref:cyclase family protein n=1 Tax=Flavobacterium columnare TaxID=996 RepID=UPI004034D5CC